MTDYHEFIRNRITELRLQKRKSEYQMSYDLGKSKGYIQAISSKKALPSMEAFIDICHYFEITPAEFFYPELAEENSVKELERLLECMRREDRGMLLQLARRLAGEEAETSEKMKW